MTNETPAALSRGSAVLVWTLVARSFGVAAGIALVLIVGAALLGAL